MKRIEDIEKLTLEELVGIGENTGVQVPSGLDEDIRTALTAAEINSSGIRSRRGLNKGMVAVYAAFAAALACLVIALALPGRPEDTFDDPALAYAEVEKALELISSKAGEGLGMAAQAEKEMDRTMEIFNR